MSEHEELAQWLDDLANDYDDLYPPKSSLKLYRAAALLREARPQPVPAWQPIDTAPHDGSEILVSDYDAIEIVSWNWDAWETGSGWIDRNGQRLYPAWWQPLPDHPPIPQPPQGGEVEQWPETFSRRQRAEEAERLCTEAGIDLKSPDAQRLVRDARDGMPLHDVHDLIKHWNATITTEPTNDD